MTDKQIIAKLLTIISDYQKDNITKDLILEVIPGRINNTVQITRLVTKGETGKGTPFYSGSLRTAILEEYYEDSIVFDANIRAEEI